MKKVCAWCGKYLGTKRPIKNNQITHCICQSCNEKELDKITARQNIMGLTQISQPKIHGQASSGDAIHN